MIHKIAWGLSLIFGGLLIGGFLSAPLLTWLLGMALIVAGIAYIAGI